MEPYAQLSGWTGILMWFFLCLTGLATFVCLEADFQTKGLRFSQSLSFSALSKALRSVVYQSIRYLGIPVAIVILGTVIGYGLDYLWPQKADPYYFLLWLTILVSPAWFMILLFVGGSLFVLPFAGLIAWLVGLFYLISLPSKLFDWIFGDKKGESP